MSFNSLMALLVRGTLDHLESKPTVIELGNQTLRASDRVLGEIIDRSKGHDSINVDGLKALISQGASARGKRAADYYRLLGFSDYTAIDVNELYGSIVMDLNKDLRESYDYRETYDLVTNNGTGEHVFNQDAIYRNTHQLTKCNGIMIHVQPFIDYVNHGFFSIHPNHYHALAVANDYEILAIGVSNRDGHGLISYGSELNHWASGPGPILVRETRVSLGVLLSEAKTLARGPRGWIRRFAGKPEARRFGAEIRRLQRQNPRLLCFSIMRKRGDSAFRIPIQTLYEDAVEDDGLKVEYGLESSV